MPIPAPARLIPAAAALLWLAGCAALPAGPGAPAKVAAAAAPASAASAAAPAVRPDPTAPKPFAEVIKDATRTDGFIPVWRKDDKVWLEIAPDRLGRLMLVTANVTNSIGQRGAYASQMAMDHAVELRLVGRTFQVLARNLAYRGGSDPALQRTVRQSFSDSLLVSAPVASAAQPDSRAVLVDAAFLMQDILGYSRLLEQSFRLSYAVDRNNSFFEQVRSGERSTALTVQLHYATARIPAPPLLPPPPNVPRVAPPSSVPDPRSLFVGVIYNFAALPDTPMAPRPADPRIGHFTDAFVDLGSDLKANPRVHYVKRWRLEKKDPAAELSEPLKPITFWLDRNIPERYRGAVTAGILEWNKAFERIGFKQAVVAKQQPDDADFDTLDSEHASVRWFTGADVGFARGPSHSDPRSGEILDADIAMSDVFARGARRFITEDVGAWAAVEPSDMSADAACTYARESADEMAFALDLLEARGELDPDSPQAEAFVQAHIKDTIMHEVGHTLGLKHNFRSSTVVTQAQLMDKDFTDRHALTGSVMDYNAPNIPLAGEPRAEFQVTTLGPYDYWAIDYAYRPLAPTEEAGELARIAARSREPLLAFADDTDAGGFGSSGLDPRDNRFDLGDDPLAWATRRIALSRELWARVQQRGPQTGDDPQRLRRSVVSGFRQLNRVPEIAAKYVGGLYTERDLPGTGRPAYRPVEPARQRAALQFLTTGLFDVDSFRFQPEFLASVGPDYVEWERGRPLSIPAAVLALQTQALDRLMDAGTAQRLLDLPYYLPEADRAGAISLHEVYTTLQSAVWRELTQGGEVDPLRRNLQRQHLQRVTKLLTRSAPGLPADALSLMRLQAGDLQSMLRRASGRRGLSVETRAHLQDSLGTLTEALQATMQRS